MLGACPGVCGVPTIAQQFLAPAETSTVVRFSPSITIDQKAHQEYEGDQAHGTEDAPQNRTKRMTVYVFGCAI
jgi:hypothetical protein